MIVYLAKSYKADPNKIIEFNDFIKDYDVTLKEYTGRTPYSNSYEFKDVEAMFVILPNFTEEFIGKGLYSQIEFCIENGIKVFHFENSKKIRKITNIRLNDTSNWTTSFGKIVTEPGYVNLMDYLPVKMRRKEITF